MMIALSSPFLGREEEEAVLEVLRSGQIAAGPRVKAFEEDFAAFIGCSYAVATCNGTTALSTALQAAGVRPGDEVITATFSFVATANAVVHIGARPVFADVDAETYNITAEHIEDALKRHPQARAVLIVHLFGHPCDMDGIMRLVAERGLLLIEDCAQAHGAEYRGRKVGSFGDAAAFSFYATKNMTTGEGGMVTTSRPEVADQARKLVNHGRVGRYLHDEVGYNHRLTDIAAAIGLVQLRRLPELNRRRQENAAFLSEALHDLPWVHLPRTNPGSSHVYHQYTIRAERRDALREWLVQRGIGAGVIYPLPMHLQPVYRHAQQVSLPVSESVSESVLSLPVHPGLTQADLEAVVQQVRAFYAGEGFDAE